MTELLTKAIEQVSSLPDEDQDMIATLILEELEAERAWDERFASGQDMLAAMADKARHNYQAGLTQPLDPDTL